MNGSPHTRPQWRVEGRTVVVTGAARGLGAVIVQAFVAAGARVAALGRVAAELGGLDTPNYVYTRLAEPRATYPMLSGTAAAWLEKQGLMR
jgi:NAD(P)-dependent dehydrogenase (short-subunit alcohol dehydrogenase family)